MSKFESEIGGRSFAGKPLKEFDVPDESGYQQEENIHINKRQSSQPQMVKMNEQDIRDFQARLSSQSSEQSPSDVEHEIRTAREVRRSGKERLNDGARRRVEMLIGMTRLTREVDINGTVYILRTLKSGEMRDSIMMASQFDGTVESPFEVRKQLVGRSLVQIAGVDLEQFIGSTTLDSRMLFIDELDEPLLSRLYDEYLELAKTAKDKYSIKTSEEASEVVEDLKK